MWVWACVLFFVFFTRLALTPDGHRRVQRDDFRSKQRKKEIREEKGNDVRRRKARDKDAEEAALADALSPLN